MAFVDGQASDEKVANAMDMEQAVGESQYALGGDLVARDNTSSTPPSPSSVRDPNSSSGDVERIVR